MSAFDSSKKKEGHFYRFMILHGKYSPKRIKETADCGQTLSVEL